jgi:hypothetical protein
MRDARPGADLRDKQNDHQACQESLITFCGHMHLLVVRKRALPMRVSSIADHLPRTSKWCQ